MNLEDLKAIRSRIDRLRRTVADLASVRADVAALELVHGDNRPVDSRHESQNELFLARLQEALRYRSELRYRVNPILERYMPLICAELRMAIDAELIQNRNERVILASTLKTYLPEEPIEELEDGK